MPGAYGPRAVPGLARVNRASDVRRVGATGKNGPVVRPRTSGPVRGVGPRRPEPGPPGRVAALVGLSVVALVATALAGPWDPPTRGESLLPWDPPEPPTLTMPPQAPPLEFAALEDVDVQPWDLTWLGLALLAVVLLWLAVLVSRWLRRHPVQLPPEAPDDAGLDAGAMLQGPGVVHPDLPTLREGVAGADLVVRRHVRPSDAVVAAWVHLEAAAGRSGVPRDRAQTPTEFTVAVLDRTPVDPAATRTLLDLYLRARFGGERMTGADVATALAALDTLAAGLGQPEAAALDEIEILPDDVADPGPADPGGPARPADPGGPARPADPPGGGDGAP